MRFAEVAVNRRVRGTFFYHVPAELSEKLSPGHLVKVAFGTAHTTGIIVALHASTPIPETKPVLERLDPVPVVTLAQIALAQWLAERTLTPLGMCLWLMLPPGLAKRGDMLYTLVQDESDEPLSAAQQRIVSLLRRRGPLRGRQLDHALRRTQWQSSITGLVKRDLVRREPVLSAPDVKPKLVRTAQLTIPPERVVDVATRLGQESRRANVLEVLLATPERRLSLGAVCLAVGCRQGPIKALEALGYVRIEPKQNWVELAAPLHIITDHVNAGSYDRTPTQKAVLTALLEANGPLPAGELDRPAVRQLTQDGTVRLWTQPAAVELLLSADEVQQRIIELRGGQPYLDILNLLAEAGQPVSVSHIYEHNNTNLAQLERLVEDGLITLGETEIWRDPLSHHDFVPTLAPPLTIDQARAWEEIRRYMDTMHWGEISPSPDISGVFLLHGVTGSGKTEIYLRAAEWVLAQGRQVIALVPEIALTPQTVRRFASRFPGRVAVVHSQLTAGERYDTWRRARAGEIHIVVGARSALFTPLPDVGLVILDEEHDDSYKQSPPVQPPYYHARETAIALMRITRGTVLLGSATPDLVTSFRARRGEYTLLRLPDRILAHRERLAEQTRQLNAPTARYQPTEAADAVSTTLPTVQVVDMRKELHAGNRSIFSRTLHRALSEVLSRREQAILFLNRRGTATFVMCRNCGYIAACPRCDTPLTYHGPHNALICHYCGYQTGHITVCPTCGSDRIRHFGQGTELIETAVQSEFPTARLVRWDRDTASDQKTHEAILGRFSSGEADILIGTQMIAKGLDLPRVTLVGIVSADTALGLPDYRTGERTFQLLTQVAGRAGRGALGGHVILQSYLPEHYAIHAAAEHDYETFYTEELAYRQEQRYPPFRRLARLLFQSSNPAHVQEEAQRMAAMLEECLKQRHFTATEIIGPTPCFFARRDALYRWHVIVRSPDPAAVLEHVDISDDWVIDIDPVDLL